MTTMAISRALAALAPHTVTITPFLDDNSYGEPTYGDAVSYSCLIEKKPKMVRNAQGEEVVSSATVYLTSAPTLSTKDLVTLPDSTTPEILSIGTYPNKDGDYFSVLYL